MRLGLLTLLCFVLPVEVAFAQDPGAAPPENASASEPAATSASRWELHVGAHAWFSGPSGTLRMPRSTSGENSRVRLATLDLDSPTLNPAGTITLRKDRWMIGARGFLLASEGSAALTEDLTLGDFSASAGQTLATNLDITGADFEVGYSILPWSAPAAQTRREQKFRSRTDLVGGTRFYAVEADVRTDTASTESSESFIELTLGARLTMQLRRFDFNLAAGVGGLPLGDSTTWSWEAVASLEFALTRNLSVQGGYRSLSYSLESGDDPSDFAYRGAIQGLFFGLSGRF